MEGTCSRRTGSSVKLFVSLVSLSVISLAAGLETGASRPRLAAIPQVQGSSEKILNVKDFKAVGDGKTDDTAAFAGALGKLAENGGGTLLIPSGTYVVGDLNVGSGTVIKGTGSTLSVLLKRHDARSILEISSGHLADSRGVLHDIKIEYVTLRGRSIEDGFSEHTHNINVSGVAKLSVQNVRIEAFQGDGIYLGKGRQQNGQIVHNSDVRVADNSFEGANNENRNGVSLIDCSRCVFEHNVFTNVSRPSMPGAIDIEPNERDEIVRDVIIRDNTITENKGGVGSISVVLYYKDFLTMPGHITIENNRIQDSKHGITVLWQGGAATKQTPSLEMIIRHNFLKEIDGPMQLDGIAGVTVDDNDFSGSRSEVMVGYDLGASGLHFINNRFERIGSNSAQGITLCGPLTDLVFEKNKFIDIGSGRQQGSAIYFARGAATNVSFTGNTFSSPSRVTQNAIRTANGASLRRETNIWKENVLQDGVRQGTFAHRVE
jgi:polygalacturonase